jgi:hypothetical protein
MGTGDADREGVESRKDPLLGMAEGFMPPAGNRSWRDIGECQGPPRDRRPRRASHGESTVTQEIRPSAPKQGAHPRTSVRSEEEGRGGRKSEAPIVAMKSGNAVEPRGAGLRQRGRRTWPDTERTLPMITALARFTRKARAEPHTRFIARMGLLWDPEGLRASFER